jgi:hypothetical protein
MSERYDERLSPEAADLCKRVRAVVEILPAPYWTVEELRALAALLESVEQAHRPVDEVGNVVYLARRR